MKNLTQLPGSGNGSKAKNDNTLGLMHGGIRSRIGSMSLKNTSLFGVILALLLTLGVGQMWAGKGFWGSGQWNVKYYDGSGSDKWIGEGNDGATKDLGIKTTLYLKGSWVKTWSDGGWTQSSVVWNYGLSSSYGNTKTATKSSVQGDQTWDFSVDYNVIANAPNNPGQNTIYMYWRLDNYVSSTASYINFTIPGFKKTSVSQDFGNVTVSSTKDLTISFTQHYGTALTTSNCALSGTNSSEFEVRSISETGVTVRFKPSSNGSKSATLTITDAHSKTCTITLSGKTQRASNGTSGTSYALGATYSSNNALTLYPTWTAKTTTITLNNADATTAGTTEVTATYDATIPTITIPTKTGYTFGGYWGAPSGTGPKYINADGTSNGTWQNEASTYTLYAAWSENKSAVTLVASPTGTGTFQVGGVTVTSTQAGVATTPAVTAVPIAGYSFDGWSITGGASISSTTDNPTTVTGGGAGTAATLTATFVEDITYYKLKFGTRSGETLNGSVAAKDGSDNPLTSNTEYLSGTSVTVTATPADDYNFDSWYHGWSTGSSFSTVNPLTFTLSEATNVYAHFIQKTTSITLNKNGGSGGTTGPVTATHGSTTLSTDPLTCPAKSNYTFTGYWTESSGGVKVIDTDGTLVASVSGYTKSGNKKWDYDDPTLTLYAQYSENMTTVTVNVSPAGAGTLTVGGDAFTPGNTTTAGVATSRTVVATAANDYTFSSWSVTGNATGSSSTNTYTLKGNGSAGTGTLTANFTLVPCSLQYGSSTPLNSPSSAVMSYDTETGAYYIDVTTNSSPYYFRFLRDSKQWSGDWSSYPDVNAVSGDGTKVACATEVQGWDNKASLKFTGASGTSIRIWFDMTNKKSWITADRDKEYVLRGAQADNSELLYGMPGWNATTSFFQGLSSGNTGTYSATLNADEWYHLKVYNMYTDAWYGKDGDGYQELTDGELLSIGSGNDFYFHTTIAGTYTFTLDKSDGMKIKVDYPSAYSVTYSAHTIAGTSGQSSEPTATYNSGANSVTSGGYVPSGTSVTFTAAAAKSGYTYNGWYDAATGGTQKSSASSYSETVSGNITRYARYTQNTHNVTLTNANSTYGTVNTSSPVTVGEAEAVQIQATPKSGYMFNGWTKTSGSGTVTYHVGAGADQLEDGSGASKATTYITTTGAVTLQATWDEDRSSGYYLRYGNGGKDGDGNSAPSMAFDWTTEETDGVFYKNPGETTGTVSYFTLTCGGSDVGKVYEFKVTDHSSWYGYNAAAGGKIDATITDQTLNTSYGNGRLCIVMPGSYVFKWDSSTEKLSITFPTGCYLRGTFNSWGWGDLLTETGNANEYACTVSLSAKQTWAAPDYGFKVVIDGVHYGKNSTSISRATNSATGCTTSGSNIGLASDVTGDYTFTVNTSTKNVTVTYPAAYTVTFDKGTGGETITATATSAGGTLTSGDFVAADDDVTFDQTASTGYTFAGWYDASTGGSAVSGMGTSDHVLDDIAANATVYSRYTPNNYTVTFDATTNGGTCGTPSKSVTFDAAYGDLPEATKDAKVFAGWYTTASGAGTQVTAETIVSNAANHTIYARFEDTYSVTIQYKSGDVTLKPNGSTTASETALAPEITAPEFLGYTFTGWTGTSATFANASSATTTVNVTAATTITANYSAIPTVYFKNNLGWEHVYVTFDAYFGEAGGATVPGQNGKPYFEMTQMGESDIFSCVIPDAIVSSWKTNIAFDNKGYASTDNVGTYGLFYQGEFIGRGDFASEATMFIPYNGDKEGRNGGTYYRTGCWMKYNSTDPGYKVYANTYKEGSGGSAVAGTPVLLTADIAGGYEFKATVNFPTPDFTYGFMLKKEATSNTNDLWYTNTSDIYASTTTLPWDFTAADASENGTRCGLHTEATGNYEITVSFATGKPMVNVTYPVSTGDWRLVYKDRATWSNGEHSAAWQHPSRVIKAKADAEDIVSFYVSKAVGANATVELQKCTAIDPGTGAQTWVKQSDVDLSGITSTGIYNFKVTQNGSKIASAAFDGGYVGNFYIRTDASDGGWSNYKTSGTNTMTYSEYSLDHGGEFGPYSHYFMRYVTAGSNIKFCIANDYSECISDTIVGDTYTGEYIAASGNVRFMWYWETNKIGRAYISGSSIVSDRFLVLEGDDKMFNEAGTALTTAAGGKVTGLNEYEMKFTDDQNWIYEATVKAKPGARIKLTAKFNDEIQYFYGKEGARSTETTDLLLGGSDTEKYKIRIVYDFKTNRLMKAFMPDGAINTDLEINADLMIIREAQNDAQQITFGANGALSEVKTVYGAMKFNKYNVNNKSKEGGHGNLGWSRYKRDLFYISFPFDVKLSDVFGFGTYGKHWIIEYYDGKERAANGFWAETETFWKFVMPSQRSSFTMKANEGYILALDLDEMTESSSIWNNDVQDVYVYFPSNGNVNDIEATNKLVTIDQTGYECTIGPRFDGGDDRTKKDSYWHCIGVPGFANYNRDLTVTNGGATIDWSDDDGTIDWSTASFPYLYEWNSTDNSLSVTTSATFAFKPMYSYMVQYAGASIYWSQINSTPSGVVARQKDAPTNIEFRLELQQGEQKADQAFVRLTDDELVTTGYDFNYDLSKEFNGGKANIYTMITSVTDNQASLTEAAGNVLPMSEQTTVVPVGVKIATNGDYTFSIPEGTEGVGVTLIDQETGIRTSLSALAYTVSLEAGTYDERFVLEISPIHNVPTEQSAVRDQQSDVRKVLIDGLLYIVRDNKMYDARGAMVMEK